MAKSLFEAAVAAYGDEETAQEFMDHFHKGSIAEAVTGNPDEFVLPCKVEGAQREKLISYLDVIARTRMEVTPS